MGGLGGRSTAAIPRALASNHQVDNAQEQTETRARAPRELLSREVAAGSPLQIPVIRALNQDWDRTSRGAGRAPGASSTRPPPLGT